MTLIEVVTGLVILGTVLASLAIARGRFARLDDRVSLGAQGDEGRQHNPDHNFSENVHVRPPSAGFCSRHGFNAGRGTRFQRGRTHWPIGRFRALLAVAPDAAGLPRRYRKAARFRP